MKNSSVKTTKLGFKLWFSVIIFGLIGQIAWIVENMYFSKFMQNNVEPEPYATTLMVALSAIAATVATVLGGALCDKIGKRKPIICWGYILWGVSTIAFAFIPVDIAMETKLKMVAVIVIMDCVMSFIGAAANDAAFNTWVTDISDTTNRGKIDVVLAIMPVAAMGVVFIGLDSLTSGKEHWGEFFTVLGLVPIVGGILGLFMLKDASNITKADTSDYWNNVFYSFKPSVIKDNKMLYVCLLGSTFSGASIQVYQSYLINFVEKTLGITDYVIPLIVIVLGSAVLSVIMGNLMDKFGKEKFYYPTILANVIGAVIVYCLKYVLGDETKMLALIMAGGVLVMGASLVMAGLFLGAFRDYIPHGKEGSFMGMRMFLFVLVPMIIGPAVAQFTINSVDMRASDGTILYPPELFLAGAVVVVFAVVPAYFVKKNDKVIRAKLIKEKEEAMK
ncbi:MAG: MFS transporter [Clostridia bacterium]|nr:MFS transporter [Clostridia bacterium]